MRLPLLSLVALFSFTARAAETINFSYKDADLVKVVEDYAKASQQKFIIDPNIKGKVTILNHEPITMTEAFNQLSSALALNSDAISKQDDVMVVMPARAVQRNLIDVGTELPPLRPEKMFMWVVQLKYSSAQDVNSQIRVLTSRDGEEVPVTRTNQLLITDWSSNLHRLAKVIQDTDIKVDGATPAHTKTTK